MAEAGSPLEVVYRKTDTLLLGVGANPKINLIPLREAFEPPVRIIVQPTLAAEQQLLDIWGRPAQPARLPLQLVQLIALVHSSDILRGTASCSAVLGRPPIHSVSPPSHRQNNNKTNHLPLP